MEQEDTYRPDQHTSPFPGTGQTITRPYNYRYKLSGL
jgi:hypothetical protein